jgi:DNA-binding Lrp family transcriptional regulator
VVYVAASLTAEQNDGFQVTVRKNDLIEAFRMKHDTAKECQSRHEIIEALKDLGVNTDELSSLSIEGLANLLQGFHVLMDNREPRRRPGRPRRNENDLPVLTKTDKIILNHLLSSQGRVSSLKLSRELDIPLSTIQRRRKRLQDSLIVTRYLLKTERLGWRNATLLISTASGKTETIGRQILDMSDLVSSVTRALGGNNIDLRAEVAFKTNTDLTTLIDRIKSIEGVSGLIWSESLNLIAERETSNKIISEC